MLLVVKKKMNKLLVVEDYKKIEDGKYNIEYSNNAHLIVENACILNCYDEKNNNIVIDLSKGSNLTLYQVSILSKDMQMDIHLKENSDLALNILIINNGKNTITINIDSLENNSKAKIKLRAINKTRASNLNVICNGTIGENTIDNELLEDLKGLILHDDMIKISPNMSVLTNEVMANHLVTIGPINEEDLFYLRSKGLSEKQAKYLMTEAFMKNILSSELKEKIKMEVINSE